MLRLTHLLGDGGSAGVFSEPLGAFPGPVTMAAAEAVPLARLLQLKVRVAFHHLALGVARAALGRGRGGRRVPLQCARVNGALAGTGPCAVAVADTAAVLGAIVLDVEVGVAFKPVEVKRELVCL